MALRGYRERRTSVQTGTDVKGDAPRRIAQELLIPQIARRTHNAIKVDGQPFYFYRRKNTGRRCSCFLGGEQSPDGECQVCFGTGFVGAYDKYGCVTEVGDITRPGLRCVNVEGNFDQRTRPVMFRLCDGAKRGWFEFDVEVRPNARLIDLLQVHDSVSDKLHSRTTAWVTTGDRTSPLTNDSLRVALAGRAFTVRVELSRDNISVASPFVSHVYMRYQTIESITILADIPRRRKSIMQAEFGLEDRYETMNMAIASDIRIIDTEDMFVLLSDSGTRWKAIDASENRPGSILTSHDIMVRLVHSYEPGFKVPV